MEEKKKNVLSNVDAKVNTKVKHTTSYNFIYKFTQLCMSLIIIGFLVCLAFSAVALCLFTTFRFITWLFF